MKVLAQPIEVISYTDNKGDIRPLRFRFQMDDDSLKVVKIDKIMFKEIEKFAGNNMLVFKCQSLINNVEHIFEVKYELNTCKWILYKI